MNALPPHGSQLPPPGLTVRPEATHDHEAVLDLHRQAFGAHGRVVADLVRGLRRDDPTALSLVADVRGDALGHVMFSRALLDAPRRLVAVQVLSPLAVAPRWQRRGVGAALVRYGLDLLDQRDVPLVFLEGDPRYYARFGFAPGGPDGFRRPSLRIPEAAFQVRRLAAYEPWMTGTLVYPATFWEHDCVGLRDPRASPSDPDDASPSDPDDGC
ncbi:N-acetyltransferase [Micromonospora sp. WMMD882]|uniref:GNAT family N-acetyltransferase n=1 Tax=Micromonospora sp. WMMD882 TaxID=3015151 RepID=UPI00248ACC7F|nr:N-acetyltransferase [Micromonospora sp. WMMD882]WBB78403.1 N-acetyltransferase [Micromonospora sp. WMMD882]